MNSTTCVSSKISAHFVCEKCQYKCSRKGDFNKHLQSVKHNTTDTTIIQHSYSCDCGKIYNHRASLYNHKKSCTYTSVSSHEENIQTTIEPIEPNSAELLVLVKELMLQMAAKDKKQDELIKQNLELQNTMREMIPHIGNNNSTTNSHNNQTFNIQMFLENECKNAISIQDFIQSIEINMSHLVAMSKDGYVDSISNVLINALNDLSVTDRPLHCTDLKRETVYIKDHATWNKSSADTSVMDKVISNIERKHVVEVKNFVDEHPRSHELDTPDHQFYQKAYYNSLGGGEDSDKLNKKIFKKVLPQVKLAQQTV